MQCSSGPITHTMDDSITTIMQKIIVSSANRVEKPTLTRIKVIALPLIDTEPASETHQYKQDEFSSTGDVIEQHAH